MMLRLLRSWHSATIVASCCRENKTVFFTLTWLILYVLSLGCERCVLARNTKLLVIWILALYTCYVCGCEEKIGTRICWKPMCRENDRFRRIWCLYMCIVYLGEWCVKTTSEPTPLVRLCVCFVFLLTQDVRSKLRLDSTRYILQ